MSQGSEQNSRTLPKPRPVASRNTIAVPKRNIVPPATKGSGLKPPTKLVQPQQMA